MYSNEVDEPKEAGLRWEVGAVTPSPHLWGRHGAGDSPTTNGQWISQSRLHNESSIETPKGQGSRTEGSRDHQGAGRVAGLERGQESHIAPSHTLRPASLPSGCSGVGSVIAIREMQEKCFPEFWELFGQITEPGKNAGRRARLRWAPRKGGEAGHPPVVGSSSRDVSWEEGFLLWRLCQLQEAGRMEPSLWTRRRHWTHLGSEAAS